MTETPQKSKPGQFKTRLIICIFSSLLLAIGSLLAVVTGRIIKVFGPEIMFDQILFHIMMPSGTIDSTIIHQFFFDSLSQKHMLVLGLTVPLCLAILSLPFRHISWMVSRTLRFFADHPATLALIFATAIFLFSCARFCKRFKVLSSIVSMFQHSEVIDDYYVNLKLTDFHQVDNKGQPIQDSEKPNLILIVSESLESTFSNPQIFAQDLLAELTKLKEKADFIEDLRQVHGCHYTIATMYAIQYGLPLLFLPHRGGSPVQKNILQKNCISIFDVLNASGYQILHLQGTKLRFAGQGELFAHLPNARCLGVEEISLAEYPERQNWGLWDSDLFDKAKKEIQEMALNQRPFALSLQTIDTHVGNVLQPGKEYRYSDARDIIRLQSKLIAEFIAWVQMQTFGKNTVIVILGDHNMMTRKLGSVNLPHSDDRQVFDCIIKSKSNGAMSTKRHAAAFDFAPTILDALSFQWPTYSLGIGRSLYRNKPTILESIGKEAWDCEAKKTSKTYTHLIRD